MMVLHDYKNFCFLKMTGTMLHFFKKKNTNLRKWDLGVHYNLIIFVFLITLVITMEDWQYITLCDLREFTHLSILVFRCYHSDGLLLQGKEIDTKISENRYFSSILHVLNYLCNLSYILMFLMIFYSSSLYLPLCNNKLLSGF